MFTVHSRGCSPLKRNRAISSMVKYMGKMGPGKSVHYEEVFTMRGFTVPYCMNVCEPHNGESIFKFK